MKMKFLCLLINQTIPLLIFEVDSDRKIIYRLQNYSMYCNSLEELESDYKEITKNYEKFKRITNDLIKDDLVEKVKEMNKI